MTFEFRASVSPNGQIAVPFDVAGQIPAGEELHVVLTWEAPVDIDEPSLGRKLRAAVAHATGEDSVYDSLA